MSVNKFMDKDLLLDTEEARTLFHKYAEDMPIIDYHCHIDPKEIAEDKNYETITDLWLAGDHYKWRLMRQCGFEERLITGKDNDRERFRAWAKTLQVAVGSPLYHWSHLELQRYFDCDLPICEKNADAIFDHCNQVLKSGKLSAKSIIKMSKVRVIGTTDDPCDDLAFHKEIQKDAGLGCKVIPTFRPDQLLLIGEESFVPYIRRLAKACDMRIFNIAGLKKALVSRMEFFNEMGCRSSDQSIAVFPFRRAEEDYEMERIFAKAMENGDMTTEERETFNTEIMLFLAENYARLGWVMQLHFGVARNTNTRMFEILGKDTGFDRIDSDAPIESLTRFLNELEFHKCLPKTVLYSLDPGMNTAIDVMSKCFAEEGVCGKVQHGAAWWFNDNLGGIRDHLRSLCEQGVIGTFIGMLTDSRCMLSYTRHEYFRRILCGYLGRLAADGLIWWDEEILGAMVRDICYYNAERFFGLA
ncbi:MAG: glucuronate isomerase [Ruminococcus sp.]|nr:glucuronate isomerase [Ruminococcus sp.]